jgi:hypothetical protein
MLLQSLRALCFAPGGPGSIWNYLEAPVRSTGVSGSFECGFRTDLHFADAGARAALPKKMLFFRDCSTGIRGAPRHVAGAPRVVAPRCFPM